MTKGCPKHCSTVTTSPASASPALDSPQMLEQRHLKVLHQILSTAWNRPCRSAESVREAVGFFMGFGRVIQRDSDDVTLYEKFWRSPRFEQKHREPTFRNFVWFDMMCYSCAIHGIFMRIQPGWLLLDERRGRIISTTWVIGDEPSHEN